MADTSVREGAREVTKKVRPSEINPKLEEAVQNQPLLPHLLSFRVVLTALAIGAVVALIALLLLSPMTAGIALLIVFFGSWFLLAARSYSKAQQAREAERTTEVDSGDSDSDDS